MVKVKIVFKIGSILCCMLPILCISCGDEIHIAGAYYCYQGNTPICAIHNVNNNMDIPPTVLKYKTDGTYITVMQKPRIPQYAIYRSIDYPIFSPDTIYYWIIKINCDSIIGPLNYTSFVNECKHRNIGDNMQFKKHALNKRGGSLVTDIKVKNLSPILETK